MKRTIGMVSILLMFVTIGFLSPAISEARSQDEIVCEMFYGHWALYGTNDSFYFTNAKTPVTEIEYANEDGCALLFQIGQWIYHGKIYRHNDSYMMESYNTDHPNDSNGTFIKVYW